MTTFENLTFTDNMELDLLRELIHDGVIPESYDPAYMTQADWDAFHADMMATPINLPTEVEVLEMAKSYGLSELPF